MLSLFAQLKKFTKIQAIKINGLCLKVNIVTTLVFLVVSIVLGAQEYLGKPILCTKNDQWSDDFINTYCWIHKTFVVKKGLIYNRNPNYLIPKSISYYQWVSFVMFGQALLFYLPNWLWGYWGYDKMRQILQPKKQFNTVDEPQAIRMLSNYLKNRHGTYRCYAIKYFFCHILSLSIVIFLIVMNEKFFGFYGIIPFGWFTLTGVPRELDFTFPKMASCKLEPVGFAGSVEYVDVLCLLPLNNFNEKAFVFTSVWFFLLLILFSCVVILHLFVILCAPFRKLVLKASLRLIEPTVLDTVLETCNFGDAFVLSLLSDNVDHVILGQILGYLTIDFGEDLDRGLPEQLWVV